MEAKTDNKSNKKSVADPERERPRISIKNKVGVQWHSHLVHSNRAKSIGRDLVAFTHYQFSVELK